MIETLREQRKRLGLTQYDLQKFIGIKQSRVSLIERGYSSPNQKERELLKQFFHAEKK